MQEFSTVFPDVTFYPKLFFPSQLLAACAVVCRTGRCRGLSLRPPSPSGTSGTHRPWPPFGQLSFLQARMFCSKCPLALWYFTGPSHLSPAINRRVTSELKSPGRDCQCLILYQKPLYSFQLGKQIVAFLVLKIRKGQTWRQMKEGNVSLILLETVTMHSQT